VARTWIYNGGKWYLANTSDSVYTQQIYNAANAANALYVGNTDATSAFTLRSKRTKLNLIPGSNITINVDSDSVADRSNIVTTGSFANTSIVRAPQVYTQAGGGAFTWSKPTGISFIIVEVQGGGGGGAGAFTSTGGAGGGAGGYARKTIAAASLGATETVTVGSGGTAGVTGGTAGAAGGSSSFGTTTFCTACGGAGGTTPTVDPGAGVLGGSGGLAISGDVNNQGGDGGSTAFYRALSGATFARQVVFAGSGGASYFGGGGSSTVASLTGAAVVAQPGKAFGSGGAGGCVGGATACGEPGAAGKEGIVIVWEFR
jgi:hypothetical protein